MSDYESYAVALARRMSDASLARSLRQEAARIPTEVFPFPVDLQPGRTDFVPGDVIVPAPSVRPANVCHDWVARRLFFPTEESPLRPGAMLAGFAGVDSVVVFKIRLTRDGAMALLLADPLVMDFCATAWDAGYPGGFTEEYVDPADVAPWRVLCDLYMPDSYHLLVSAPSSFWPQLIGIARSLSDGDVLLYQVLFVPVREHWQPNIAALSKGLHTIAGTKPLDEPLFAAAIRIACTTPLLAGPMGSFVGRFTAGGRPLRYRSLSSFRAVLSEPTVQGLLRCHASHTVGQLLTAGELAHFVHAPHPGLR
jgi:hypothetical protein